MSLGSGTSQSESHRSTRRAPVCLRRFVMLLYRTESALFAYSLLLTFIGGLFLLYPYEPNRRGWLPSLQKTTNETSDQESEAMSCRLAIADLGNPRHFHWFSRRTIDSLYMTNSNWWFPYYPVLPNSRESQDLCLTAMNGLIDSTTFWWPTAFPRTFHSVF